MNADSRGRPPLLFILLLAAVLWSTGEEARAQVRLYAGQDFAPDFFGPENCMISD
jgi:hypothetical protein